MRKTAGVVCAIITIVIYGAAIISGIVYTDTYSKLHLNFDSDFYYTWIGIILTAAVLSAIHHGIWSIIDNQIAIYDKMKQLEAHLERLQIHAGTASIPQTAAASAPSDANSADGRAKLPSSIPGNSDKECPFCGAPMRGSRCDKCGKYCD